MYLHYRLFVSDIDGTLINGEKQISKENKRLVDVYRHLGGQVTLATGRSYIETRKFIAELNVKIPVILCNGAMVFDPKRDELHTVTRLDREKTLSLIFDIQRTLPAADIFVCTPRATYTTGMSDFTVDGLDKDGYLIEEVGQFANIPEDRPIIKFVIVSPHVKTTVVPYLRNRPALNKLTVVQSSDDYLEILPPHTSKGNALTRLADKWNIPLEQVAVIGDHLNDLSMFEVAGLSAAVGNAHPLTKQKADVIMPTNEQHAVAHYLQQYLINFPSQTKSLAAIR